MRIGVNKKGLSLRHKIVGSFLVIMFFSSFVIGFYTYHKAKSSIETAVGNTAVSIVKSIVSTINTEKFDKLQTQEDMGSDYYKELQTHLSSIREATGLKYIYTMRKNNDGKYVYVVDGLSKDDKSFSPLGDEEKDISNAMLEGFEGKTEYEYSSDEWGNLVSAYIPIKDSTGKVEGILGADFDANMMVDQLNKLKTSIIVIVAAVILIGILLSSALSIVLVRSLNKLKAKAELIKAGDLTVKFDKISSDEVGELSRSFSDMVNNMFIITKEIKNNTKNVVYEIDDMYKSFSETNKAAEDITKVSNEIAAEALNQTVSVDEVSESMNKVFELVRNSVEHANLVSSSSNDAMASSTQALDIFKTSIEKVVTVNKTVENTAAIVEKLGKQSKEINSFSETISQITKQTDLLSLNAAIEAARAGEHGRGFAVVANEIKALAEESNKASKQISEIASTMQEEIGNAVKVIEFGVLQANEGVNSVTKVDSYLLQLQKSSKDAYMKIKEIIDAISLIESYCKSAVNKIYNLADNSRNFSAGSEEAAASTEEQSAIMNQIMGNIDNIRKMTNCLNDVVNKFKIE